MSNTKNILAFDFGASSGRAMLAAFDGKTISMQEAHRFSNDPVQVRDTLYWDNLRLYHEIKMGLQKANQMGGFDSVGIDTWGVDFALLGAQGEMLENSVHYRDIRTDGMIEHVFTRMSSEQLYSRTGIQLQQFNTLFQLLALKLKRPDLLERAKGMLFMPDFFNYLLTGKRAAEFTIASTSQLLDPVSGGWNTALMQELGLPTDILPQIAECGTSCGNILPEICAELNIPTAEVIRVGSHDTASAVVAVPSQEKDFLYISSGTWSLMGAEADRNQITPATYAANFTNEGGYGRTTRLLKNIMGLWLIQESRRQWRREGTELSFSEIDQLALQAAPFRSIINPDDPSFSRPGDMPGQIRAFCRKTNQPEPATPGEVARCIYESLALKYAATRQSLCQITGKPYSAIHIVGGGSQSKLLNRFTAAAAGVPVICGPIEATALGNLAVQLIASGELKDISDARRVIADSFPTFTLEPETDSAWQDAAGRYAAICENN